MNLLETINHDLNASLKSKDKAGVDLLRLLKAALKNEMIDLKRDDLKDDDVIRVLKKEAKKRQDAITLFEQGGRNELALKEEQELVRIKKYLPEQMSREQIMELAKQVLVSLGETGSNQFGQVMKTVMQKAAGRADGAVVSEVVRGLMN